MTAPATNSERPSTAAQHGLDPPLSVSAEFYADDAVVVSATGEVDASTIGKLDSMAACAVSELSSHLIFDLTGVAFLSVAGLKTLATTIEQARPNGIDISVVGTHAPVRRALNLLNHPPTSYTTLSAALRARQPRTETGRAVLRAPTR